MNKKYIHILIFTLAIIGVGAIIIYGAVHLTSSVPAWQEKDTLDDATAPPTTAATEAQPKRELLRDKPGHVPTVVLDAGHGFGDVGCAGPNTPLGVFEFEYTMDMVNTLRSYLAEAGYRVLLTHDGKSFPTTDEIYALCQEYHVPVDTTKTTWVNDEVFSPYERVIYMNVLDAMYGVDFALSVHINANAESDKLNGFDLDYCAENDWSAESKVYAENLRRILSEEYPGRNLWYYEDSWDDAFVVTKYNSMPSALLETGYYTNEEDCALLTDKAWRDRLMENTATAIEEVIDSEYEER